MHLLRTAAAGIHKQYQFDITFNVIAAGFYLSLQMPYEKLGSFSGKKTKKPNNPTHSVIRSELPSYNTTDDKTKFFPLQMTSVTVCNLYLLIYHQS